jgi:hypothetical protein
MAMISMRSGAIDTTASHNRPGFGLLGISPRSLEEELKAILTEIKTQ